MFVWHHTMMPHSLSSIPALSEALFFHQNGRLAEAEIMFRQVIKDNPDNHIALHGLGILLVENENYRTAQEMVEEAIALSPKTPNYYRTLARIYVAAKLLNDAKNAYRTALFLEPLHADTLIGLAEIAEIEKDYYNAIAYYREALEANQHSGSLHYHLAENLYHAGFLEESVNHYERAHQLLPYSLRIILRFSDVLLMTSRYLSCRSLLDYAADYYPGHAQLQYIQALLYMKIECYDLAVCHFESALEELKDDRQILLNYADCLRQLGDIVSADKVIEIVDRL